jgi:hypothetical protein
MNVRLKCVALLVAGTIIALIVPAHAQEACCYNPIQKRKFIAPSGNCGPRWEAIPIPINECRTGQLSPPQENPMDIIDAVPTFCLDRTAGIAFRVKTPRCPPGTDGISEWDYNRWPTKR